MKKRGLPEEPLFRFLDIQVTDIAQYPSTVDDIRNRRLDGVIVRGALSPMTVASVVDRLERRNPPFSRATFPGFPESDTSPHVLGRTIVTSSPDLVEYFADAAAFRRSLKALFRGESEFEERLEAVLHALSGGRPVGIPKGLDGNAYTPATIRVLPPGHEIAVHVGNGFLRLPQAQHLSTLIEVGNQLSYFIPLSVPEAGGELVVYALEWDDVEPYLPESGAASVEHVYIFASGVLPLIELCDKTTFAPGAGDLLLFDGGHYYHRITPVRGTRPRRTIGGFLALSRDHGAVSYWS